MGHGYYLGTNSTCLACEAYVGDSTKTNTTGYHLGANSKAIGCRADLFAIGCRTNGAGALITDSTIDNCELAVDIAAAFSGATFCNGTNNSTGTSSGVIQNVIDFGNSIGAEAVSRSDIYGNWYSSKSVAFEREATATFSGATGLFYPRVDGKRVQVARCTYAGAQTLTVNKPSKLDGTYPTMPDGSTVTIVVQAAAGCTVTLSMAADYYMTSPAAISPANYRAQTFRYHSVTGKWVAIDNPTIVALDAWP